MKVSKHHYAMELATRGNRVYFIEPPNLEMNGISVVPCQDNNNIKLVRYKPIFRGRRFLPSFLFGFLLRVQIKKLVKVIGEKPDLVISFHGYLFEDLRCFKATKTVFFAADVFGHQSLPGEVFTSDINLAISDSIYALMKKSGRPVFRMNHGLQKIFADYALTRIEGIKVANIPNSPLVVGYSGNLRMQAMDLVTMKRVIETFPDVVFVFWGSYESGEGNLGSIIDFEMDEFISFLKTSENVKLRGMISADKLLTEMKEVDMFWICWRIQKTGLWDGSNSHKLLEYLSTGKPVVAHCVSSYQGTAYLWMLEEIKNDLYLDLFRSSLDRVKSNETENEIRHRLKFAIDNSYSSQIDRIEKLLNGSLS